MPWKTSITEPVRRRSIDEQLGAHLVRQDILAVPSDAICPAISTRTIQPNSVTLGGANPCNQQRRGCAPPSPPRSIEI